MEPQPFDQQVTFLRVADLDRTTAFYRDVLKLPLVLDQGPCRIFRAAGAAFVGFCRHLEGERPSGVILTLVTVQVDQWYQYLLTQDVLVEKPPQKNERFNIYHLFLRDPDGYLVEIQQFLDPAWPAA